MRARFCMIELAKGRIRIALTAICTNSSRMCIASTPIMHRYSANHIVLTAIVLALTNIGIALSVFYIA